MGRSGTIYQVTSEQDLIPRIVIPWFVCADTNARNAGQC